MVFINKQYLIIFIFIIIIIIILIAFNLMILYLQLIKTNILGKKLSNN